MLGVLVNVAAVVVGGLLGVLLKKGIPQKVEQCVMAALGLCVLVIGVDGAISGMETLVVIISLVLGTIFGSILDIDKQINRLGDYVNKKISADGTISVAEGFVAATLLFCVGAMAVVGSINSGLRGDHTMLFTKSILDFFSAIMLAVSLGGGVMLSGASILVFQGAIALLAGVLEPILAAVPGSVEQISCVGSIMIMAIGTNLMGVTKIKVANMLPGIVLTPVVLWIYQFMSHVM